MSSTKNCDSIGWLYDQITGDEDARVCKDIPDEACKEQPRNFFAYLLANVFNKISDELASARLTLPWLFNTLGVPSSLIGFLVPIREAGVLLPQLIVAAYVRSIPKRKPVWLTGAVLSALAMFFMALTAINFTGMTAGIILIGLLVIYSLARGLCSVSAKDVLGKTVSKTRRGRLMGYTASLAGVVTLGIGISLQFNIINTNSGDILTIFLFTSAIFWLFALASFSLIIEPDGSTEGGGNALTVALENIKILKNDKLFREYLISRILLLSVALVIPFYVLLIQAKMDSNIATLGALIVSSGLSSSLSAPVIGKLSDYSSRLVMVLFSFIAGFLGILVWLNNELMNHPVLLFISFFLITLCHSSVRLGRKVYLVDMSKDDNRATYVALSNTIVGIAMLVAGFIGILGDIYNTQVVILTLSIIALFAGLYISRIRNVSG